MKDGKMLDSDSATTQLIAPAIYEEFQWPDLAAPSSEKLVPCQFDNDHFLCSFSPCAPRVLKQIHHS